MANRIKFTNRARAQFLVVLEATCNVSEAARSIGMSRRAMYDARDRDESFREDWDEAVAIATDALEREARRRALEGWEETVYYKGEPVGAIRRYSDRMMELLLRAHLPDKYRENVKTQADVNVNITGADPKQDLHDRIAALAARSGTDGGNRVPVN